MSIVPSRSRACAATSARRAAAHRVRLQLQLPPGLRDGDQRVFRVGQGGQRLLAVVRRELGVFALLQIILALEIIAVEQRLRRVGHDLPADGLRRREILDQGALHAILPGQRDRREESGPRLQHREFLRGELRLRLGDIRPAQQHFRRQSGLDPREAQPGQRNALRVEAFRRAPEQHREQVFLLAKGLLQRRNQSLFRVEHGLLLRGVEHGGGADLEPHLDRLVNLVGDPDVFTRDAQPVLRVQHLEIGVQHRGDGGDFDHVAIEAAGVGEQPRGLRGVLVLAPEIDLVAGVQPELVEIISGRGDGSAGRGRRRDGRAGGRARDELRPGNLVALRGIVHRQRGPQRRAGNPGLRVGLGDAGHGGGDVVVVFQRLIHDAGQLPGAESRGEITGGAERRRRSGLGFAETRRRRRAHVGLLPIEIAAPQCRQ